MTAVCVRCGSDEFGIRTNGRRYCKPCNRARVRAWQQANPARAAARGRRWHQANTERVVALARRWIQANPDKYLEIQKRGRALRRQRAATAAGGPFVAERYVGRVALYSGMCAYCDRARATELDHGIPLSRGGGNWPANVYPACVPCNRRKHAKKLWSEWVPPKAR